MSISDKFPDWKRKMKLLADGVWQDAHINEAKIDHWLENFRGQFTNIDREQESAFYLLQQFIYYGKQEVYECFRVLFRDHFVYPTVQNLRRAGNQPSSIEHKLVERLLHHTRIVGVGYTAESGPSFLYDFRIANNLPTAVFASVEELIQPISLASINLLEHIIYFDDFCGTGQQVKSRVETDVRLLRTLYKNIKISYYLLFATRNGIETVQNANIFDNVEAAIIFDDDYKAFQVDSHYFTGAPLNVDKVMTEQICRHYGEQIYRPEPLGYQDCQLMVGFEHNTPDNTLPIFWSSSSSVPWHPIFPRMHKQ